jgi:hypothetical protein
MENKTEQKDQKQNNKSKKKEEIIRKPPVPRVKRSSEPTLNIDYIFRREQYTLKNQKLTLTFGEMRKLISQELKIPESNLQINYLEKELTSSKVKINDLIKDNKIKFFEVKKKVQSTISDGILSYSHVVKVNNIKDALDFNKQIDTFFLDLCLEKNCISEPTSLDSYNVSFARNDLAFDFNKFLTILKKSNPLYENIEFKIEIPKQSKIIHILDSSEGKNGKKFKNPSAEEFKKKLGNFVTYSDLKRIQNMEGREKWIDQKGFIYSAGPVKNKNL